MWPVLECHLQSTIEKLATVLSIYDKKQTALLELASKYDKQQEINNALQRDLANMSRSNNSTRVLAFSGIFGFIFYKIFIKAKWVIGY